MYESHYGLQSKPFSIVPNPEILFLSKNHENALTYLEYGLSEKAGFILLTGEIGAGKTTLIRHMMNNLTNRIESAVIFNTNFSSDQLFRRILSEFEVDCETTDKEGQLAQLYQFLIDRYAKGRHVLLIVDEAQNLPDDVLEDIRMLSNLQTDDQILLQIILVGQPELKDRLSMPEFHQIAQRIAVSYHIRPLDKDQTHRYIAYRIEKAGGDPDLFSREAIDMIYRYSGGIPRSINLMCDTALVYGFGDNLENINTDVIAKIVEDDICMAVNREKADSKTFKRVVSKGEAGPGIMERIHWLEMSFSDLKQRQEDFMQVVKEDLLLKYQQLLIAERHRFDQLLEQHVQLAQSNRLPQELEVEKNERGDIPEPPQQSRSKTKFSHLMKMVDEQDSLDRERLTFSDLLEKTKSGR